MIKISILLFLFSVPCSMHAAAHGFNPPGSDYGVYLKDVVGGDPFVCEWMTPEWRAKAAEDLCASNGLAESDEAESDEAESDEAESDEAESDEAELVNSPQDDESSRVAGRKRSRGESEAEIPSDAASERPVRSAGEEKREELRIREKIRAIKRKNTRLVHLVQEDAPTSPELVRYNQFVAYVDTQLSTPLVNFAEPLGVKPKSQEEANRRSARRHREGRLAFIDEIGPGLLGLCEQWLGALQSLVGDTKVESDRSDRSRRRGRAKIDEMWGDIRAIIKENDRLVSALVAGSHLSKLEQDSYNEFLMDVEVRQGWTLTKFADVSKTTLESPKEGTDPGGAKKNANRQSAKLHRDGRRALLERIGPRLIDKSNEWNRWLLDRVNRLTSSSLHHPLPF